MRLVKASEIPGGNVPTVKIGDRVVGGDEPCLIIAEIGINHNGDLDTTRKLIDAAIEAGADAVKFQKRTIDVVYTAEELDRPRDSVFGTTNREQKYGLEFDFEEYSTIDQYCKSKEIMWFASCWDEASVDFIDQFNPPCYKIASASLTDADLLSYTAAKGKPLLMSTGMSTVEQVRAAANTVRNILGNEFVLLHCVSTYPAENSELNLRAISSMRAEFDVPIGYSGHERGVSPSVMAAVLGAEVVERHITLDRTMWGSDQSASLEPRGLAMLVRDIRVWEASRGDGTKQLLDSEVPIMEKLRRKNTLVAGPGD